MLERERPIQNATRRSVLGTAWRRERIESGPFAGKARRRGGTKDALVGA